MHLKNIKLAGFKSFVDVTTIPVRSHMNAIVGPNGCGKSNVVDAIRWVIGETSAKQLRGKSMTDVIFNGTTTRKPVGKASVELCFDNSDGRVGGEYAKYSEIAVRREVTRDAQSNYFLNNTACRRRDIVDIFLGTGLGSRGYAVIEQGMISRLVEAKPEEFRVHLEEVAGISKYKERRRETENRIKRTQENLDRINDLCEELAKQLRHLKRQSNAAERYKDFKEEERLLHAQIKALQWQALNAQASLQDENINTQTLQHEEQLANQRHVETDIEKARVAQIEATDQQNEVQKRFYSLAADIARIEQRIKDAQEQTLRWKAELEEADALWQELTESTAEHQDQIQELSEELEQLSPSASDFQAAAASAQEALKAADIDMKACQQRWETFQKAHAESMRRSDVARNNIQHQQQQLQSLENRQQRLTESVDQQSLNDLQAEIQPVANQVNELETSLASVKESMSAVTQQIQQQRQENGHSNNALNALQGELQSLEGRFASLTALQQAALAGDDQANAWLSSQSLENAPRLGKTLKVNAGWEQAVETVMRGYFDAVCVDQVSSFVDHIDQLKAGSLTLVDRQSSASSSSHYHKAQTLMSQVQSDWPIQEWLSGVYIADDAASALLLRSQLSAEESVITRDGLWLGVNWMRVSKPRDDESGILSREQELKTLDQQISDKQTAIVAQRAALQAGEQRLLQLENDRDTKQQQFQSVSAELTSAQSRFSAKKTRFAELQQQQQRLESELSHCQEQMTQSQQALETANTQLEESTKELRQQEQQQVQLSAERERAAQTLEAARETANREQQRADELEIRVSSTESQLALLRQTVSRSERQMENLQERRETLNEKLSSNDGPSDSLNAELQEQLSKRVSVEQELRAAEAALQEASERIRQLDASRNALHKKISDIKDQLQSLQMARQEITVRQTTIQEQLSETDFVLETVIEEMPEGAEVTEWEQRAEKIAQRISRLGPINLAAIDEYQSVNERKTYLDKQQEDLIEALDVLKEAMRKIDRETRAKFRETYDKVNEGFKTLFPRIFGGGSACLELEEEGDLLTTGVIVKAQPPGKRNTTIHLLSGGEKALTAISLVFAMFQLNPAPFCVLDEVDAPLDDLNVGRFCQLVKEMSQQTQFIVISHNKVTIEMADHLMGVTMQEPGASRVVSVDIEEAITMAEA